MEGQELAERHIALRERAGLTQEQEAKMAGVSPTTISGIESGKITRPHLKTLLKIARALGADVGELREPGKVKAPSSQEKLFNNGVLEEERHIPSLRSWIDFAGRMADRWEAEFEEREAEWQAAEPHIRKNVKRLPNLTWATEILRSYTDILEAVSTELHYGLYVYETAEVQELFTNTQRLEEVWERTKPWYQGEEAPRMAEVIDLQQAVAERVAQFTARNSQSA